MFLSTSSLQAQNAYGAIVGTVTDTSGAVVPGATVTVININTNEKKSMKSEAAGNFRFVNLLPTQYKVEIEKTNFKKVVQSPITVLVDATARVDVALQVGATTETVEVTTAAPLLQTESGTLGSQVEGKTVEEMPLNGRNTMNLIALVPGVVPEGASQGTASMNQGGGHTNNAGWGNYQIGGSIAGQGAMFFDGAPLAGLGGNLVSFIPTQDAIQEFKVSTSATSAEFGRFGGGVVEMTSKSGANKFYGSAYEYLRNSVLNANDYFNKQSELASDQQNKPGKWNQNQYGVTVGGRVLKDKAFFFFSWEKFSSRTGQYEATNAPDTGMMADSSPSVPKLLSTAGLPASQQHCLVPDASTGRTTILTTCLDPASQVLKKYFPTMTVAPGSNNFAKTVGYGDDTKQYNARGDINLSANQRLFVRYSNMNLHDTPFNVFNNANGFKTGNAISDYKTQQGVIGDTYTLNPTTILDTRLSYLREFFDDMPDNAGTNVSSLGLGSNWTTIGAAETLTGLPHVSINGPYNLFSFFAMGIIDENWLDTSSLSASLTKLKGNHTLKLGGEIRFMDHSSLPNINDGTVNVSNGAFAGDEWANFLLGDLSNFSIGVASKVASFNWYQGYYLTDTWSATRKLTINAGLRWELPGGMAERKDRGTVLLPNADTTVNGSPAHGVLALLNYTDPTTGISWRDRTTEAAKHNLLSPRLGVAYRLDNNTVVRAGYALTYIAPDLGNVLPNGSTVNGASTSSSNLNNVEYTVSNPLGFGTANAIAINKPVGRTQGNSFISSYANTSSDPSQLQGISGAVPTSDFTYMQQWNVSVGHQFKGDQSVELGYAGALGVHLLPPSGWSLNQLPKSAAYALANGTITTAQAQAARAHPSYSGVTNGNALVGTSSYNSMQLRYEKRFGSGGTVSSGYTWAKSIGDADSPSGFLDNGAEGTIQDYNNIKGERSIQSYSYKHRWITSYVLDLPFGRGKLFANNVNGVTARIIGGWAVNGITTFQSGHPVALNEYSNPFGATGNQLSQQWGGGVTRPDYIAGCSKGTSGSAASRAANGWFNKNCFTMAGKNDPLITSGNLQFAEGNEPRVDSSITAQGLDNWDFSALKSTKITEGTNLQFRMEFFNIFNHTQFSTPQTDVTSPIVSTVTSQANHPRQIQASLRFAF
jgi:hypothetical protein